MARILVVDDDPAIRFALLELLRTAGHEGIACEDGREALPKLSDVDLVLTDLAMPGMDGLELLQAAARKNVNVPIIMLTAFGSERIAVNAIKAGAYDYIAKPFDNDELLIAVERALETMALKRHNRQLEAERAVGRRFIAESAAMKRLLDGVSRVASRDVTVLLRGETGTGKELIASLIHAGSTRRDGPLVRFNCAALPSELAEAELFGHAKGAFTGADSARDGYFRRANGGTLVLDEVGELPLAIQSSLLRAVQLGELQRIGSSEVEQVDVRIVACTNRDLLSEVKAGRFREDLYYRLAVVDLVVPSLRDRREDVAPLAREFARIYAKRFGLMSDQLSDELIERLQHTHWPGNVRQLENAVARLAALSRDGFQDADVSLLDSPNEQPDSVGGGLKAEVAALERQLLAKALIATDGNMSEAARRLQIGRATLFDKLQKYGLDQHGQPKPQRAGNQDKDA